MTYYNNSPRMDNFSAAPPTPRDTKPVYTNTGSNTYINAAPTKISSPFDDDPPADTYNNPYNPDYVHSSDNYNQSPFNSTQEHSLSTYSEKAPPSAVVAGEQTYAMQHLSNNGQYDNSYNLNRDSYRSNNFYNGYDEDRPSLSNDTAPMRPYNDLENSDGLTRSKSGVTRVKYAKEKSKYLPCFPCIRSTCGRVTCCICLFLLLVIIVLVIIVFTVFKLPTVNYLGTTADPNFEFNQGNTTLAVSFVAQIQVINPNPIGFKFESIVATAYYPNYAPSIGGGSLNNVDFPKKSNQTINFPISASYSLSQDTGLTVVKDVLTRCGATGSAATDLTIDYDLKLTVKIIGISISPTIKNQHASFACPANYEDIAANIPGGIGSIIGLTGSS